MSTTNTLEELLKNKNSTLCCLCLTSTATEEGPMQINDTIYLNPEDCLDSTVLMSDMIKFVLHQKDFVTTSVCKICVISTVNAYKFIQMCANITQRLAQLVDGVTTCLEQQDKKQVKKSHRLFIATDVNNSQHILYYDTKNQLPYHRGKSKIQRSLFRFNAISNPESVPKFICATCGHVCNKRATLVYHIKMYCNKTACDICGQLISKSHTTQHKQVCGNISVEDPLLAERKDYLCNICGKRFTSLKKHMATHAEHRYECKKCGRKFKRLKSYGNHIQNEICTKSQTKDPFQIKPYKCKICNSEYSVHQAFKTHMRIHSDNKNDYHECSWCQKRFPCPGQLASHAVTHTKEKNWKCDICGGKFVTRASLTYHVRTHTGEKPYKCEFCENSFLSASRRRDHVKARHLPKEQCTYCYKIFSPSVLAAHYRRHRKKLDQKNSKNQDFSQLKNINKLRSSNLSNISLNKSLMARSRRQQINRAIHEDTKDINSYSIMNDIIIT